VRTIPINVYEYDELSPKAQEKARDWWRRSSESDDDWAESVIEDAETILGMLGFESIKIYYSGFWCQGDGACFEATWRNSQCHADQLKAHAPTDKDLHKTADALQLVCASFPHMYFKVNHSGHYYHQYCTAFDFSFTDNEDNELESYRSVYGEQAADDVEKQLMSLSRELMVWIYDSLEKEYYWWNADEQVADTIKCNDYEFTEDGKVF